MRWCRRNQAPCPEIVGIDLDASKVRKAKRMLGSAPNITVTQGNFLTCELGSFDYIIGNPPYVPIEELTEAELLDYRERFQTARGRVDLYLLFWERALDVLRPSGRVVFLRIQSTALKKLPVPDQLLQYLSLQSLAA